MIGSRHVKTAHYTLLLYYHQPSTYTAATVSAELQGVTGTTVYIIELLELPAAQC